MPRLRVNAMSARGTCSWTRPAARSAAQRSRPLRLPTALALPAGLSRAQRFALTAAVVGQATISAAPRPRPSPCTERRSTRTPGPGKSGSGGAAAAGRSGASGTDSVAMPVYGAPFVPAGRGGAGGAGGVAKAGSGGEPVAFPVYGAPFVDAGQNDDDAGER